MPKRQLISIVSAVLLAAHLSAGCCAHHEHKPDGSACISFAFQHDDQHGHTAHDHTGQYGDCDHSTPQHDHEPGDHHCGEGHCKFVAASKVNMPDLTSTWAMLPTGAATLLSQIAQPAATPIAAADHTALFPVRSHLVKQVLLI